MKKSAFIFGLAALSAAPLMAVQGTISTEVDSKTGDIKWQPRSKSYIVTYKMKGSKGDVNSEYPLGDVTDLQIPKPATFDKAVEMVEKGQGAAAIGTLSKIVSEYRMLNWDKVAGRYLVLAYLAANQAQKAMDTCSTIINEDKTAAYRGDLAFAYWQTLLKLGKTTQLESVLKKAVSSGDRAASAAALVMRGDIMLATQKETPDLYKQALRDAYLRVVLMYNQPECVREQADAMIKAATCFDKLGQAARAEQLRTKAKSL